MMLTNFLPVAGNGPIVLHATATDMDGHTVELGSKAITCDNASAVKPFGAIDTPAQGGTASGNPFNNFGWALTRQPNMIPVDGSTIGVWVDGVMVGRPSYNYFRSDIATLFPGYLNSNGAVGLLGLNTTALTNGVHNIGWSVRDNAGNEDGIGSRYFSVLNTGSPAPSPEAAALGGVDDLASYATIFSPAFGFRKGFDLNAPFEPAPAVRGDVVRVVIEETERLEVRLVPEGSPAAALSGYQIFGPELRRLPIGSTLLLPAGVFAWQPGPGFLGDFDLVFLDKDSQVKTFLKVRIVPRGYLKKGPDRS
jgi:hypothetical protein